MRGRRVLTVVMTTLLMVTALPAATGGAGEGAGTADTGVLETLLVENLGLSPEQAAQWAAGMADVSGDVSRFGRGGDASVPATITAEDEPWTEPVAMGLNFLMWQDPSTLPDLGDGVATGDGMAIGTVEGGPATGTPFAVATLVFADDIPMGADTVSGFGQAASDSFISQWDIPLLVLGLAQWFALAQFPDDTWNFASFVMSLTLNAGVWALAFYTFTQTGQIGTATFPGFFLVAGNVMIIAVLTTAFGLFGPNLPFGVSGRFAGDFRTTTGDRDAVVTTPTVPLMEDSFRPFTPRTFVPGLPGWFDPVDAWAIEDADGYLWFNVKPAEPWGMMPPEDIWSYYLQVGLFGDPSVQFPTSYFGFQQHKGVSELFGSTADGPVTEGLGGYLMNDGSLLIRTPVMYDGNPLAVVLDGGTQDDPEGQFLNTSLPLRFDPEDVVSDPDPMRHDGLYPVYDLATGETLEPPPDTVTTTTLPASTVTTQPGSTTVTTQPGSTVTRTPTSTENPCWWCWAVIILFLAVLLCILCVWLKSYEWWTCWIPWLLVIFIWVPFLLAGLWWWRPTWWWVPLLAWFPLIGGYAWGWARHRTWWQPWHWYVVAGYCAALVLGMVLVGSPEWGLLFPLFWVPWVGFYLWFRGARRPWFQPWMWLLAAGWVAWVFLWVISLTPWWAWWLPVAVVPILGWWFVQNGYSWHEIHGPKWCWVLPFAFLPFLAWWIPLWEPWWCIAIIGFLVMTLVCATFTHYREQEWWTWWLLWLVLLFVWAPLLLAGLWFFRPSWWAWGLLPWLVLVPAATWWWARRRPWWQSWMYYAVGGYLVVAAAATYIVGTPEWGLLLPVFWLPWVGLWVWHRGMRQPWWRPWMLGLVMAYSAWVVIWLGWLTPWWGWWFPVFFLPFWGWWAINHGYQWALFHQKSCWLVPWCLAPWFGYMIGLYCIVGGM